ncbi:MAG TPA: glycoside hydrolase family 20 zincin-like fold domain-containing protein, partial [Polyangiaceae bacterium]|nr:glycoside hydrolase family 20 zincin-like fold domain-containing protein [Polyangiaceae bacterium]
MIPRFFEQDSDTGRLSLRSLRSLSVAGSREFTSAVRPMLDLFSAELHGFGVSAALASGEWTGGQPALSVVEEPDLPDEGYRLEVSAVGVRLVASTARGAFYGTRSLLVALGTSGELSYGRVVDRPR